MGGVAAQRSARRYRRARRLRSHKRGVVAVIGTLLSLLVFFALFGIFLTQYLPLWMTDNESAFTSAAATSFAQFKGDVDSQYVLGAPPVLGAPFTVSSAGIPLLAQPTEGTLTFLPQTCPAGFITAATDGGNASRIGQPVNPAYCIFENQTMAYGPGGIPSFNLEAVTGVLEMQLPNRYFTGETFEYEADGVVQVQSGTYQIMAFAPPFNVTRLAGNTTVSSSFLQLYGNATSFISQGTAEVYSHLRFNQYLTSNGIPTARSFQYTYEIGTQNPCAWSQFIQSQLSTSGVPAAQYIWHAYAGSCLNPGGTTTVLKLTLTAVNYVSVYYAGAQVSIGIGSS
jgi:hypothetical protein